MFTHLAGKIAAAAAGDTIRRISDDFEHVCAHSYEARGGEVYYRRCMVHHAASLLTQDFNAVFAVDPHGKPPAKLADAPVVKVPDAITVRYGTETLINSRDCY